MIVNVTANESTAAAKNGSSVAPATTKTTSPSAVVAGPTKSSNASQPKRRPVLSGSASVPWSVASTRPADAITVPSMTTLG